MASGYCPHSRVAACGSTPPATPCWRAWPRAPPQRSQRRDRRCRRRAAAAVAAASSESSALSHCCCSSRGARAARKRAPERAAARQAHRRSSHRSRSPARRACSAASRTAAQHWSLRRAHLRARLHILCAVRDSAVWRCCAISQNHAHVRPSAAARHRCADGRRRQRPAANAAAAAQAFRCRHSTSRVPPWLGCPSTHSFSSLPLCADAGEQGHSALQL